MTSTIAANQGPSPEEDNGFDVDPQFNAAVTTTEQIPVYGDNAKGLGIYVSHPSIRTCCSIDLAATIC